MTLSEISIRRPVFAWMLMFGLIIFGAISFNRLGVSQMPDVDFPLLSIQIAWEGAAPAVMEAEIVDPIEQSVMSIEGIREVFSTVRQGRANVNIEFDLKRDIDVALQEVQANISRVRLPIDVNDPIIMKTNPDDEPIMWIGIGSEQRSLRDLSIYLDLNLRDQFQTLPGVGEVILSGFAERNLRIWADNQKLKQYELTLQDLKRAIELQHVEVAAGYIENKDNELNVRMMGEGLTPEQVGNIYITQRGGVPIYETHIQIRDVARVEDALNDIRLLSRIDGRPGVGIGIKKQRGANAVEVAEGVRARLEEIKKRVPEDIKIGINFDATRFIEEAVGETKFTLLLSALITGLVCWIFLGSWNSTVNVILAIPTSIVGTFTVLYFLGFTLNMFTLLGLALAVGIVVDDAIMVLENIVRHHELGKDRVSAARIGAREITFAALAATIAIMAIFLPVAFMRGAIGYFFFQFGMTISVAVGLSLLEAITLTPMRCSRFLTVTASENRRGLSAFMDRMNERWARGYHRLLGHTLNHRWKVLLASLAFFVASLGCLKFIKGEFLPAQDMSMFMFSFETPVGSSLEYTSDKIKQAEKVLLARPELDRLFVNVGGFFGGEVNSGVAFATLVPAKERGLRQDEIQAQVAAELGKIEGLKAYPFDFASQGFSGSGSGQPVEFSIRGSDYQTLKAKADELVKRMESTGLVTNMRSDYKEGMPEVRIWPDREKASQSGVSVDDIAQTISAGIGGVRQGKYSSDARRYDVRIRLDPEQRLTPEDIQKLQVRTIYGELLPLDRLVKIETVPTVLSITRRMRERSITITSGLAPGASQAEALAQVQDIAREILPEGMRIALSGTAQSMQETGEDFMFALVLGLVISYMVLASQFNSFLHPITILIGALPFSLSGALMALLVTGQTMNLYSGIGILLLMGIVKKNSILLVEFTNKLRYEQGMNVKEAILKAAPIRLRPIMMTSFATMAAAIPPALAVGPGAESRIPMAIAVFGGVLVSTLFTLVVVPCSYSLLSRMERMKPVGGVNPEFTDQHAGAPCKSQPQPL
jgi:hydrophobe/amphiphile efflux-1 (HAE1) family protein